uniref:Ovule protein n=1 Tax=Echinococcus granulosus TaxID=6210 RepID=A0A068WU43_ECHGR|nr:hypothetical protein EgrG_002037500 [Echinococcus granulosus]
MFRILGINVHIRQRDLLTSWKRWSMPQFNVTLCLQNTSPLCLHYDSVNSTSSEPKSSSPLPPPITSIAILLFESVTSDGEDSSTMLPDSQVTSADTKQGDVSSAKAK